VQLLLDFRFCLHLFHHLSERYFLHFFKVVSLIRYAHVVMMLTNGQRILAKAILPLHLSTLGRWVRSEAVLLSVMHCPLQTSLQPLAATLCSLMHSSVGNNFQYCPLPLGDSGPHVAYGSTTWTAFQSVQRFLYGLLLCPDRQTDRPSVARAHIFALCVCDAA